jgi:hypothetical protein
VLVYPPAALLSIGVLLVTRWRSGLLALGLACAVLVPQLPAGSSSGVLTAAEARRFPEFGASGPLHFFVDSTTEYLLQNRSGVNLRPAAWILVLAALALLLVRPANVRLLRAPVLALPLVSLAAFAAAHAVLFRLYLPHRYTYPLVAFAAIVAGVALLPTWQALLRRVPRPRLAAIGAAATALALLAAMLAQDRHGPGSRCPDRPAVRFLASLPKDAIVAGDPIDLKCVVATAGRAVVISTQLAPSYEAGYFRIGRERMFATLLAVYGPSRQAIAELRARYGVTHLWVRRDAIRAERSGDRVRWHGWRRPYGQLVRRLLATGEPAVLHLPDGCRSWHAGADAVYDVACVAATRERDGNQS